MTELWLTISDAPDYEISSLGRVRSLKRSTPLILKPILMGKIYKYYNVNLWHNGAMKHHKIHRLVAEAFHGPCPVNQECRHLDGNPLNNVSSNLKWGTKKENAQDRMAHGTDALCGGNKERTYCRKGHEFTEANTYLNKRSNGKIWRQCKTCRRITWNRFDKKRRKNR